MSDKTEVFALLVIDLTNEQTSAGGNKWLKSWRGYGNILKLAATLPVSRVFDARSQFDSSERNSLRYLYPNFGIVGTPGANIVPELKDLKATTIKKVQYSAFFGSNLEQKLKEQGATTVILTGIQTDYCIFATALDAFYHGFKVIIVQVGDRKGTKSSPFNVVLMCQDACASQIGPAGQRRGIGDSLRFLGSFCRSVTAEMAMKAIQAEDLSVLGEDTEL